MNKPNQTAAKRGPSGNGAAHRASLRSQETASNQAGIKEPVAPVNRTAFNGFGGRQLTDSELRRQAELLKSSRFGLNWAVEIKQFESVFLPKRFLHQFHVRSG